MPQISMNILFIVPWDQEYGGVASVVGNLAKYLKEQGHMVRFLHPGCSNILKSKLTKWGFRGFELNLREPFYHLHPFRSVLSFFVFFPTTMIQIIYLILRNHFQVVNIHYLEESFIYFAFCRRFLSFKLIVSIHGGDFFPGGKRKNKYSRSLKHLLNAADRIVAPSKKFMDEFLLVFPEQKKKGMFIHNSIDLREFISLEKEIAQGDCRISREDCRKILCVAAHNEKKGIDVLLHAFAKLREMEENVKLLLVGDGPLRKSLEDLALNLEIGDQVKFLGWKNRADMFKLLKDCEIFVLPSRSESFGIVIIEAMACGKPVIAASVGGIPEIIEHGKNGILVKPDSPAELAQAISNLLRDSSLIQQITSEALMDVKKRFTHKHTGSLYEFLYREILNGEGGCDAAIASKSNHKFHCGVNSL